MFFYRMAALFFVNGDTKLMSCKFLLISSAMVISSVLSSAAAESGDVYLEQATLERVNSSFTANIYDVTTQIQILNDALPNAPTTGTGSLAYILQDGVDNSALIDQMGPLNLGLVQQSGDFNSGTILQSGSSNVGLIYQSGAYNVANIQQTGSGHRGAIFQSGRNNTAILVQH